MSPKFPRVCVGVCGDGGGRVSTVSSDCYLLGNAHKLVTRHKCHKSLCSIGAGIHLYIIR